MGPPVNLVEPPAGHRAGRYLRTSAGTPAFVPAALNHARPIDFNVIGQLLPAADRALGRLEGALTLLPQADAVAAMLRRQEAVASGRLEGVQASLLDLLDLESGVTPVGPARDVAELKALSEALARPATGTPAQHLLAAQALLLRAMGLKGNGWRRAQVWVGAAGASMAEARYVPPPPEQITELMQDWEQFLATDATQHPLVKLSLTTAQLENIHPFQEAGGRLTRLFLVQQLWSDGSISQPALLWSIPMQRQRHPLLQTQQALRSHGDVERWVQFFLKSIAEAADETVGVLRRVAELTAKHRQEIRSGFGRVTSQALLLLDALIARPVIGIKDVIELTGTSFPAANELAHRLVRAGILAEITGHARNRRFRYAPYVRAFLDDD